MNKNNKTIKTITIFTLLKIGEIGLLFGILLLSHYVGSFLMEKDIHCDYLEEQPCEKSFMEYFSQTLIGLLVTVIVLGLLTVIILLAIVPLVKMNWNYAKKIVNNKK